jgi:hypothetical protein
MTCKSFLERQSAGKKRRTGEKVFNEFIKNFFLLEFFSFSLEFRFALQLFCRQRV